MRFHTLLLLSSLLLAFLALAPQSALAARPRARVRAPKGHAAAAKKLAEAVRCGVCLDLVSAIEAKVATAAVEHPYDVLARFRLDEKRRIPYCRSEPFVQGITDSASQYSHLWGLRGYVPSASNPLRVAEITPRDGTAPIPGLVATREAQDAFVDVAVDLFEEHQEALTLAIMRAGDADAAKKAFCVDVSGSCKAGEWPVVFGESSYVPPPPVAAAEEKEAAVGTEGEGEGEGIEKANVPAAAAADIAAKKAIAAAAARKATEEKKAAAAAAAAEGEAVAEAAKDEL